MSNNTYVKPRRTTTQPYVSVYRNQAIITVPYTEEGYEWSFSIRKAKAFMKMVESGEMKKIIAYAEGVQDLHNKKMEEAASKLAEIIVV